MSDTHEEASGTPRGTKRATALTIHGRFTHEEEDAMREAISQYAKSHQLSPVSLDWLFDRSKRGLPRAAPCGCAELAVRQIKPSLVQGPWGNDEVEQLRQLVAAQQEAGQRRDFAAIAEALGRTCRDVRTQWFIVGTGVDEGAVGTRKHWSKDEVDEFERLVRDQLPNQGKTDGGKEELEGRINWDKVSEQLRTRTSCQCRTKWGHMRCEIELRQWDNSDQRRLLRALRNGGYQDFKQVSWGKALVKGRLGQTARQRWLDCLAAVPQHETMAFQDVVGLLLAQCGPLDSEEEEGEASQPPPASQAASNKNKRALTPTSEDQPPAGGCAGAGPTTAQAEEQGEGVAQEDVVGCSSDRAAEGHQPPTKRRKAECTAAGSKRQHASQQGGGGGGATSINTAEGDVARQGLPQEGQAGQHEEAGGGDGSGRARKKMKLKVGGTEVQAQQQGGLAAGGASTVGEAPWDPLDVLRLRRLAAAMDQQGQGSKWPKIAKRLGRTRHEVKAKFRLIGAMDHGRPVEIKRWSIQETVLLNKHVRKQLSKQGEQGVDWDKVAAKVMTHSADRCRKRSKDQVKERQLHWPAGSSRKLISALHQGGYRKASKVPWDTIVSGCSCEVTQRQWQLLRATVPGQEYMNMKQVVGCLAQEFGLMPSTHQPAAVKGKRKHDVPVAAAAAGEQPTKGSKRAKV